MRIQWLQERKIWEHLSSSLQMFLQITTVIRAHFLHMYPLSIMIGQIYIVCALGFRYLVTGVPFSNLFTESISCYPWVVTLVVVTLLQIIEYITFGLTFSL